MAVKIRLSRHGAKKAPFYRVVVQDGRSARDGRFIEIVGRYNPRTDPSTIEIDLERVDKWISKGAQLTEAAGKIVASARGEKQAPSQEAKPSKKAVAKAEAEKKAKAEAEAAAKAEAEAAAKAAAEAAAAAAEAEKASAKEVTTTEESTDEAAE